MKDYFSFKKVPKATRMRLCAIKFATSGGSISELNSVVAMTSGSAPFFTLAAIPAVIARLWPFLAPKV